MRQIKVYYREKIDLHLAHWAEKSSQELAHGWSGHGQR